MPATHRQREQELDSRRAEVERARAQVGITNAQLADTTVYSPIDGIVLVKSAELGEVVAGRTQGRTSPEQITLFKSHGLALEDVAVGAYVYAQARAQRIGVELPF